MDATACLAEIDYVIGGFHKRASRYRIIFLVLRSSQIVAAASIPVVSIMAPITVQPTVSGLLGALIVVMEGLLGAFEFQRYWVRYRYGGLLLNGERRLFRGNAGPYKDAADPESLYVERANTVIKDVQSGWMTLTERIGGAHRDDKSSS